ncbi:MAG: hypothetical protein ABR874_21065 [Candidatus Sulfotelmatobacter sp.]|jgi:hypothetical protein
MFNRSAVAVLGAICLTVILAESSRASGPPAKSPFQIVTTPNENQPYPKENYLLSVSASSSTDIWSVGASTIHYDGTNWTAFPAPDMPGNGSNLLNGVADVSPDNVWAVGYINFQIVGAYQSPIVEHFDGTSWSVFPSPQFPAPQTAELNSITAISANDIWAGGEEFEDPYAFPLLEHFDGTSWTQYSPPVSNCIVRGISADSTDDIWAVGSTLGGGTCTLHYNGSAWTGIHSPNQCCGYNILNGVVALAPNNVWAAGWYIQSPTDDRPVFTLVEHWTGSSWQIVHSPNVGQSGKTSNELRGIFAATANNVWAVGETIDIASDQGYTLAMRWNGEKWTAVSTPNIALHGFYADVLDGGIAIPGSDIWLVGSNDVAYTLALKSPTQ